MKQIGEINGSIIRQAEKEKVFCFRSGARVNADGDPRAYHPEKGKGKDLLGNAGRNGSWWAIATEDGLEDGKPVIQGPDDPAPGFYVCMTSLIDKNFRESNPRRYVDSSKIPFIVLPIHNYFGAVLGDFAMVCNTQNGKYCGAIFADAGPKDKIGEVSIALATELGIDSSPISGGSDASDFLYVVFPGTSMGWPIEPGVIKSAAGKLFTEWGGFGKLALFYPNLIPRSNTDSKQEEKMGADKPQADVKVIAKIKTTRPTPFKIGPELKAKKDLQPNEYIDLQAEQALDVVEIVSENDRSHYRLSVLNNNGGTTTGWLYNLDAAFITHPDGTDPEGDEKIYKGAAATVKKMKPIDPNNKKEIQEALIRVGLLDPPAGGKWGSLSESAKRAWLRVCGEATDWNPSVLERLANHPGINDLDYRPVDSSDTENVLVTKAVEKMVEMGFHVAVSMGSDAPCYNLFYLAGIDPNGKLNNDRVDTFNDLRCLVSIDSIGRVTKHGVWIATVDAGNYWRGSRRMNDAGALQVDKNVQFLNLSCVGRHGAKQYEALVQSGNLTATRDRTGDGRTADDTKDEGSHFGSNDHHAWDADVNSVGMHSAGCCVGRTISGHQKMMSILKTDRRYRCNNGYAWHRTILDGKLIT